MNPVDFLAQAEDMVSPGMSACQGCAAECALRTVLKVFGEKTIIGIPPGCMAGAGGGGWDKRSGVKIPSTMPLLDNVASLMAGIKKGTKDPDVKVVAFAGDGATGDAGLQCLSAAAERKEKIIYVCYDNEGYMNTGFQKSGTTPYGASTSTTPAGKFGTGKVNFKKDVPMMMAIQDAAYVATLSVAHIPDFLNKLEKAMEVQDGLVYLHILSPCPTGWGIKPELSIQYARAAVQSRYFLLYEYRQGEFTISAPTKNINELRPVDDFIRGQKRFKHLTEEDIKIIQDYSGKRWEILKRLAGQA